MSSPEPQFKGISSSALSLLMGLFSNLHMTTGKTMTLTIRTFVGEAVSLLSSTLSMFVIALLWRSKCLLISWLQSLSSMIMETKKIKSVIAFAFSTSICYEVRGAEAIIIVFWMLNFKPAFSLSSFTLIRRPFSSSSLSAIRMVSSAHLSLLIFLQ